MRRIVLAVAVLAALGTVPAAGGVDASHAQKRLKAGKVRLKSFGSCAALVRYGRSHVNRGPGAAPPPPSPPIFMPLRRVNPGAEVLTTPDATPPSAPVTEDGASGTNVQEAGVDEPDVVKAAGSRIFAIGGGRLHAVHPDGPRLLGSLELPGYGHELLLRGDRLLAISHEAAAGSGKQCMPMISPRDPACWSAANTESGADAGLSEAGRSGFYGRAGSSEGGGLA